MPAIPPGNRRYFVMLVALTLATTACQAEVTAPPDVDSTEVNVVGDLEDMAPLPFDDGQQLSEFDVSQPQNMTIDPQLATPADEPTSAPEASDGLDSNGDQPTVTELTPEGILRPPTTVVSSPVPGETATSTTIQPPTSGAPSTTPAPTTAVPSTTPAPTTAVPSTTPAPTTAVPSTTPAPTTAVPSTTPPTPTPTEAWAYVGQPLASRQLANLAVRGGESYAYRFEARETARLRQIQVYTVVNTSRSGYAGGTGGTTTFALRQGSPTGPVLASATYAPNLNDGYGPAGDGSQVSFTENHPITYPTLDLSADLVAGATYYIVASNPSSSNYVSINHGYATRSARGPVGPTTAEFGLLRNWDDTGWVEYTSPNSTSQYAPSLLLQTDRGNYGNSAADPRYDFDQNVSGSRSIRQTFSVDSQTTVSSLALSSSGGGTIRATVGGTSVVINTSGNWQWDVVPLNATLPAGDHVLLIESVSGSATFGVFRYGEDGLGKLWPQGGSWDGGHVEYNTGSGWEKVFVADTDLVGVALGTS